MKAPTATATATATAVMLTAFLSMVSGQTATSSEAQAIKAEVMQTKILIGMLKISLDAHQRQADATDTTLELIKTYSAAAKTTLDAHITNAQEINILLGTISSKAENIEATLEEYETNMESLKLSWNKHEMLLKNLEGRWNIHQTEGVGTTWENTDKKTRPIWSDLITKTAQSLGGQSKEYKDTLKSILTEKLIDWGAEAVKGTLKETLTHYLKVSLSLEPSDLQKIPTRVSYEAFRASMNNLKSMTSQRILKKEVDDNEEIVKDSGKRTGEIQVWTHVILGVMICVLVIVIISFSGWFCYVCKRTKADDEAQSRRADARAQRETEGRIAGQVVHELQPLAPQPSAPLQPAARIYRP